MLNTAQPFIVVLTGAGISAESGIKTFRAADGLWENHRVEEVATPEGFAADPELVQRFYNARRRQLLYDGIEPNPAHYALAELEDRYPGDFLLVTQNIDDLHECAGSRQLVHMHGEILKMRCVDCAEVFPIRADISVEDRCPGCQLPGKLRPQVVWFGEMPLEMERIYTALARCTLFVAVGTSGNVYPAAGFVQEASRCGAHSVEINLEASSMESCFDKHIYGPASRELPDFVRKLLAVVDDL